MARRRRGTSHFRFRFLDLCIRFGKMISKVCCCFLSGAKFDTKCCYSIIILISKNKTYSFEISVRDKGSEVGIGKISYKVNMLMGEHSILPV